MKLRQNGDKQGRICIPTELRPEGFVGKCYLYLVEYSYEKSKVKILLSMTANPKMQLIGTRIIGDRGRICIGDLLKGIIKNENVGFIVYSQDGCVYIQSAN